jgi:hypothetical protein
MFFPGRRTVWLSGAAQAAGAVASHTRKSHAAEAKSARATGYLLPIV